ncbi:dual specificity protein phosphatase 12 [Auricularia subglabra TFB-10046 SS5]|nr:dual specificity protein phosphatase 12 [Auricularia subglabra TFB-10046 SS5]
MSMMDEIQPGLFLGPWEAAFEDDDLRRAGVTHILSVMRLGRLAAPAGIEQREIPALDSPKFDLLSHFPDGIRFIRRALEADGKVLVHCQAGISRSATIVAAYLMYTQRLTPGAALAIIRARRSCIHPNVGFLQQLEIFYKAGYSVPAGYEAIPLHYTKKAGVRKAGKNARTQMDMNVQLPQAPIGNRIRCRMCRRELATRDHMFPHGAQPTPSPPPAPDSSLEADEESATGSAIATSSEPAQSHLPTTDAPPAPPVPLIHPTCSGYFLEPLDWMRSFLDEGLVEGKIVCPNAKCSAKLGNYAWAGVKCACGEWVTPGFCIHRSKVDEMR